MKFPDKIIFCAPFTLKEAGPDHATYEYWVESITLFSNGDAEWVRNSTMRDGGSWSDKYKECYFGKHYATLVYREPE